MLRLTLEMVPFGREDEKHLIGVLEIANIGGDADLGTYRCTMDEWKNRKKQKRRKDQVCRVEGYPRRYGAWQLVVMVLEKIYFRH